MAGNVPGFAVGFFSIIQLVQFSLYGCPDLPGGEGYEWVFGSGGMLGGHVGILFGFVQLPDIEV